MTTLLTLLSCLAALALLAVVAVYLVLIGRELDAIGGNPTSYLAKIRFGLRAIETGLLSMLGHPTGRRLGGRVGTDGR